MLIAGGIVYLFFKETPDIVALGIACCVGLIASIIVGGIVHDATLAVEPPESKPPHIKRPVEPDDPQDAPG